MVKVGVPHWADEPLLAKLPPEAEVHVLPKKPSASVDIDFWVAPLFKKDAEPVAPYLRGVKVVQSLQAGVDWLRAFVPPAAILCDAQGAHNVATSEWAVTAILASMNWHFGSDAAAPIIWSALMSVCVASFGANAHAAVDATY